MDMITVTSRLGHPMERAREICSKIYNLHQDDVEITQIDDHAAKVRFNENVVDMDSIAVLTTDDGAFTGYINLYPAVRDGKMHTFNEIVAYLKSEELEIVDEELIDKLYGFFASGQVVENEVVAKGIRPIQGKDAEITLHFESKNGNQRPKIKDGKVDFKNLDNIVTVNKGAILITKKPAVQGKKGRNIKGEEITPAPVHDIVILPGDGATVNEAGTIFTATTDGYVDFGNKRLGVYPVYMVKGNVDYSTGNIKFNGSVHVKGDVLSGFRIEAGKHILVDGICQDCELIAKENIILRTGMKTNGEGLIHCGGNAIIGYAEKAKVYARGDIEIRKYAFNCELFAGNKIDASAGDGIIAGGLVRAYSEISAKQLGTQGNSKFTIILGMKYYIDLELEKLRREKVRLQETITNVEDALSRFNLRRANIARHPKIVKMQEVKNSLKDLLAELIKREEKLILENKAPSPKMKIKGKVYEGLTVLFYNVSAVVKEPMENMVFYYDEKFSEVVWISLKNANNFD